MYDLKREDITDDIVVIMLVISLAVSELLYLHVTGMIKSLSSVGVNILG